MASLERDEWVELIKAGGDPFMSALDEAVGDGLERLDLRGANLAGADLSEPGPIPWDLTRADLSGARVNARHLRQCRLEDAIVTHLSTDGDWGDLDWVLRLWGPDDDWNAYRAGKRVPLLTRIDLERVDFGMKDLRDVAFSMANLAGAKLGRATLERAAFGACELSGASFVGARVVATKLERATLDGADFSEASLELCFFNRSSLERASFASATLVDCAFGASKLAGATFNRAHLTTSVFDRADLARADFRDAMMVDVNLAGADVAGTDFTGASGVDLVACTNADQAKL